MNIVTAPDPTLRQVCEPCEVGDKGLKRLAKQMAKAMYKNNGCGLAAPQVGVTKRLVVIDCDPESTGDYIALVNPVITETRGEEVTEEDALLRVCPARASRCPSAARSGRAASTSTSTATRACSRATACLVAACSMSAITWTARTLFESCSPLDRIKALQEYEQARALGARPGEMSVEPRVR